MVVDVVVEIADIDRLAINVARFEMARDKLTRKRITRTSKHASENRPVTPFVTTLLTLLSDAALIPSTKVLVISFLSTDVDAHTVRNSRNSADAPYSEGCTFLTTRRLAT